MMNQERLMQVLLAPHISEKSTFTAEHNKQFVFRVLGNADKNEIKSAVELLFNVQVNSVQTSNVKGKSKRSGKRIGRRSDWKKAYVGLKPGFDIDFTGNK